MVIETRVKCRRCGRDAPASEFTVDYVYKMAVCANCVRERKASSNSSNHPVKNSPLSKSIMSEPKQNAVKQSVAVDWDEDDEFLEKTAGKKVVSEGVKVVKLDSGKLLYPCPKCKYKFKYDAERNNPNKCPFCATLVRK
ncbi:hypothetical protein COV13_01415 [Candidatus Woesearchaeota archaeon CG10_big_fil_rev_8_21_14_0_10_32_9]|nr:MAG: hypothetical protein COV13_01415 [Candidatus Woesearchaeota archaeon CG10_big_fil_rev_8_21_14_0_10_32_9]